MWIFSYLFWPNPEATTYDNSKVMMLLILCGSLVLLSFLLSFWRRRVRNPVTKRLSRTWASAAFWFGVTGLLFIVSRVEGISFLSMRFWWIVWALSVLFYLFVQLRLFRARHYTILPKERIDDPREKYLPRKK